MSCRLGAAALAGCIAIALSSAAFSRGEWPDSPNRAWFENLQRPDNDVHPERRYDPKSLYCCGEADVVKTKFKVESQRRPSPRRRLVRLAKRKVGLKSQKRNSSRIHLQLRSTALLAGGYDPMLRAAKGWSVSANDV
jgi:hypothetical protein